ncbi:MAG: hypothetical protein ACRDQW_08215 [Haloechinothrix sp.]
MLILVLVALGLLITALITASSVWAWVSIGLSIAAGLALFVDWVRRRRRESVDEAESPEEFTAAGEDTVPEHTAAEDTVAEDRVAEPAGGEHEFEQPKAGESEPAAVIVNENENESPAEEDTDAADLLIVCDLDDQVIVVDEHPRYHLLGCAWLSDRETIPIAVAEARELGFTPCAPCGPDAVLAAKHRARAGKV